MENLGELLLDGGTAEIKQVTECEQEEVESWGRSAAITAPEG